MLGVFNTPTNGLFGSADAARLPGKVSITSLDQTSNRSLASLGGFTTLDSVAVRGFKQI